MVYTTMTSAADDPGYPAGRTLTQISRRQHIGLRPPVGRHRGMVLYSPERLREEFAALGLAPGTPATVPVLREAYKCKRRKK